MTIGSSGQLSFPNIQTEFGGSNPISMDEYVYFRTAGKDYAHGAVPGPGGLSISDFYSGDASPVYEAILDVGDSKWILEKKSYSTSQTDTGTITNTFTEYQSNTYLYGYDGDTDYLNLVTRSAGGNQYSWSQITDTFGTLSTITTRGTFSGRTIEGLYWSEEKSDLYMVLDNNSTPSFTSIAIGGNAYKSSDLDAGSPTTFTDSQTSTSRSLYTWTAAVNPFGKVVTFIDSQANTSSEIVTTNFNSPEETTHGFWTGCRVRLTTTGTLPSGLSTGTDYYIIDSSSQTFKFATSRDNARSGTAINITGATGGGTHTVRPRHQIWITG